MEDVGIVYVLWVYFTDIWYILWLFGIFSPFWYVVPRKIWQPWSQASKNDADESDNAGVHHREADADRRHQGDGKGVGTTTFPDDVRSAERNNGIIM
jgi:hypothetical protein